MTKWTDLPVYRNLEPTEIPKSFKAFAHFIHDKLKVEFPYFKESKTYKKIFRITDDFEQAITFENSGREKNQKDFRIDICIKPLFTDTPEIDFILFKAHELDKAFKMGYPLTQEYLLLAEHLIELIERKVLPFFNEYSNVENVVNGETDLLKYQDYGHFAPSDDLIYKCAFRNRSKKLFLKHNEKYIKRDQESLNWLKEHLLKNTEKDNKPILDRIGQLNLEKTIFENDELYAKEIEKQNNRRIEYINNIEKFKPN